MPIIIEYYEYFGPDFSLHPEIGTKHENTNTKTVSSVSNGNTTFLKSYIFTDL